MFLYNSLVLELFLYVALMYDCSFNVMVHHCITPFNVKSLCLNSILIHLYTNTKVNNDWEANHMQALYINLPLIVGVFIGGVGIKHLVRIANTTSLLLLEWGSFLTIINWVYLCDCHIQSLSFSFSPISINKHIFIQVQNHF